MSTTYIKITDFCGSHGIETTYVERLQDYGLISLHDREFIQHEELPRVEKIIRLNREMDINFEGIDVILNLLERIEKLDTDVQKLRNRLNLYE
ncbi:MerR family transcriptional regulator [Dokdonia sinensis]|uniref:MerR family transcriptional regulator n=1 Tax=Dokdonia sinensis TaxID=2479847 RepID=A0A3M0G2F3_9FLAO|nr:chaperone modulator CbpM [Dokdonia sinensis]RMB59130.1 MerR family transcriptional regulator [Dokdonia sinensis]